MAEGRLTLLLLIIFWMAWLYTEVTEHFARDDFTRDVTIFMNRGDRFTQQEGDALEARILALEEGRSPDAVE